MANLSVISLNSGYMTPRIDTRSDVEKYSSGCRILENMLPLLYGPVERRPGTEYIATAKNTPEVIRLIPFIYSVTIAYMVEFGDLYARFYYDGSRVLSSGDIVETVTPYLVADLPQVQYKQSADVMWLVHTSYPPYKLSRVSALEFSMAKIAFTNGPFLERNDIAVEDDVTMTSSVTAADSTGTLTASAATFEAGHIGSLWKLTHKREDTSIKGSRTTVGVIDAALDVKGSWTCSTHGNWGMTFEIQRNEDGTNWETFRTYTSVLTGGQGSRNVQKTDIEEVDGVQYRMYVTSVDTPAGTIRADLTVNDPVLDGIVRIDAVTSDVEAVTTVLSKVASTDATKRWAEGAWSGVRGYPTSFTFFEERAVYAGSTNNARRVWFSKTGKFENFETGDKDADAFELDLPTANSIRWIASLDALIAGTSGDEWRIRSTSIDAALTPTNFDIRQQTARGCRNIQSLEVNEAVLFVDFVGRKIRELAYSEERQKFLSPNLTALAEDITEGGITSLAHQRNPDSIVWGTLANGTLLSMTYEREQNVVAWAKHPLGLKQVDTTSYETETEAIAFYTGSDELNGYTAAKCRPDGNLDKTFSDDGVYEVEELPSSGTNDILESAIDGSIYVVHGYPDIIDGWYAGTIVNVVGVVSIGDTVTGGTGGGTFLVEDIYYRPATTNGYVWLKHLSGPLGAANEVFDDGAGNVFEIPTFDNMERKKMAKLAADGIRDESWGENGYKWVAGTLVGWLREDKNGNLYGGIRTGGGLNVIFSLDKNGKHRWLHESAAGSRLYPAQSYAAVLSEDHEHIYIACKLAGLGGASSITNYNVIKLKTSDGTYDITWSTGGRFMQGSHYAFGYNPDAFAITRFPGTEEIAFHHDARLINGRRYSITKLAADGFRDTAWGEDGNGMSGEYRQPVEAGYAYHGSLVCDEAKRLFAASYHIDSDGVEDDTICHVEIYDSTGEILYSFTVTDVGTTRVVNCLFVLADYIYLGGEKRTEDGITSPIHRYTFAGVHDTTWPGTDYLNGGIVDEEISLISQNIIISKTTTTTEMGGRAESVAVIPGEDEDEVWLATLRNINGTNTCFIERMKPRRFGMLEDAFFVGCGLSYDGEPTDTFSGLDHLEGETVSILGDGAVYAEQVVTDGSITINNEVEKAHVGLPFEYKVSPMRLDVTTGAGATLGSIKNISELSISFLETLNARYGDGTDTYDIDWRTTEVYGSPPDMFTGLKTVAFDGGFSAEDTIIISGRDPLPATIRSITARIEKTGR